MSKNVVRTIVALVLFCCMGAASAGALQQLRDFHQQVRNFHARFDQDVIGSEGSVLQASSGEVWLQRPDRFRWDYGKPYPQLIVSDGSKLWVYDSELEQVTVKRLDQAVGNAPALVLSGKHPLEQDFDIRQLADRDGLSWVELTPKKPEADFKNVQLGFGDDLQRMVLHDNFGQTTHIRFSDVRRNQHLDPSLFRFEVPDGVEVVGEIR